MTPSEQLPAWTPPKEPPEWELVGANLRDQLLASPITQVEYEQDESAEVTFANGRIERAINEREVRVIGYFIQDQLNKITRSGGFTA